MIAMAARHWPLAVAALAAVAGIVAAVVVATTDSPQPTPEFTLNSTTRPIPDGALTSDGGSCTTITRSTRGEPVVVVHAHLVSLCTMPLRIDLSGTIPARQLWIGESEATPARPQSTLPGSFRGVAPVVIRHLPELPAQLSYGELREAFRALQPVELWRARLPTLIVPAESFRLYFQ